MGSAPVGVQCLLTSSLGEFLGYWAGSGILGYRTCWCPLSFPLPSMSRCLSIHSSSPAIELISFMFLLYCRRISTHSVDLQLRPTHFLGKFPGLGLDMEPEVVVSEAEQGSGEE